MSPYPYPEQYRPGTGAEVCEQAHDFLSRCVRAISLCAQTPIVDDVANALSRQVGLKKYRPFSANPLPALGQLALVKDMKLAKEFRHFALGLPWDYSPRTDDKGTQLAVCDFTRLFELGEFQVGLIYVDCHQQYPLHQHPPHELYFLISGTAKWRYGKHTEYQSLTGGNLIHNEPNDWHGVIAGPTPTLALYVQWS